MVKTLSARIIGFIASLLLTIIAYLLIMNPIEGAAPLLLLLAGLQGIVQAVCFLHILNEKGPRWNLVLFLSTLVGVLIIVIFTIWIMNHLNYNMMPSELMQK